MVAIEVDATTPDSKNDGFNDKLQLLNAAPVANLQSCKDLLFLICEAPAIGMTTGWWMKAPSYCREVSDVSPEQEWISKPTKRQHPKL